MTTTLAGTGFLCISCVMCSLKNTVQPYNILTFCVFSEPKICKPFKESRIRFSAWRAGRPAIDNPIRRTGQATISLQNRFLGNDSWAP
jgi:hypothetical protein